MVLADLHVDNIYLITGYTDMRKSVPGLVAIIVQQYQMRPDERSAFLFWTKSPAWAGEASVSRVE